MLESVDEVIIRAFEWGQSGLLANKFGCFNMVKQLLGLWRDTWWLWLGFVLLTLGFSFLLGYYFLLLLPCLPIPFFYFAINRYDETGTEKRDLGA